MDNRIYRAHGLPAPQGLYNPQHEKDACGVGSIANKNGERSHFIIESGLSILKNLQHRGATGEDPLAGDGAGILCQIPHEFFWHLARKENFELPAETDYGVGMMFLPPDENDRAACMRRVEDVIASEKQELINWRKVPTNGDCLSQNMRHLEPEVYQVFIKRQTLDAEGFERKLYAIRRLIEKSIEDLEVEQKGFFYICSMSSKTIVYKGMLLAPQLEQYYPDLSEETFKSSIALVHQRYSTNTFPTWGLAHPFRYIAHNGEINTLQGNANWARAREGQLESDYFGEDLPKILPTIQPGGSDSASFDNYFEMLVQASGRSMEHVMMMMVPEAWENDKTMHPKLKGFYEYHNALLEPWDGPAALMFTNGTQLGGALDRNGLRPVRYVETYDGYFVMASEVGVIDFPADSIKEKGRLAPGKMVLIDTDSGRIMYDEDIKKTVSNQRPYSTWVEDNKIHLSDLPSPPSANHPRHDTLRLRQRVFGYTYETLHLLVQPMGEEGIETTYSMGTDTPPAVLSDRSRTLFTYFKQRFAQVTNPAIDSIREESVMSLFMNVGGSYNLLDEIPGHTKLLQIEQPVLTNSELEQMRHGKGGYFRSWTLDICFPFEEKTLSEAVDDLCKTAEQAVKEGFRTLILSDRSFSEKMAPIPALLATAAVHHYLIRANLRGRIGLIVESGEVREVHHLALLLGYGAGAVNPYLAFESLTEMEMLGQLKKGIDQNQAQYNYIKAMQKGLKKIFAKMGISTLSSYQGAQIFEAVGIDSTVINKYFTGTHSVIQGVDINNMHLEVVERHKRAYAPEARQFLKLLTGGEYNWRSQGENHLYDPESIHLLQQSAWKNDPELYKQFSKRMNERNVKLCKLRGLFDFNYNQCTPVPIEEVESVENITKRFITGAMSIGSISREAHETLAVAMNRLGARSNTGEGGEDPKRFTPDANGDLRRSKIKQVASGRFGVTSHYLMNADEIQIKVAQGAKPGEGGQLPGFKVDDYIGMLRHTIPGVTLISPPPHHDIYSIEDLSQLIFDLKNSNPAADVSVKLVSESGVGTVAAGVSKAMADSVTISGHDGGTGASPATSIKHAGMPWEIGLAETQQTLVINNLRGQIRVQVDGQITTGRDVIIGGLLGAEEFGFATSALITMGCIMMRKCHLNTCPMGVATQDPELRKKFKGKAEYVVNYFKFIAQEVREIMAQLGFKKFEDLIGQVQLLKTAEGINHWKAKGLDFSPLFVKPASNEGVYRNIKKQREMLDDALDHELIKQAQMAIEHGKPVHFSASIRNVNRTAGTILGSEVTKKYGAEGLPEDTIKVDFTGTAGQSFGAFLPNGVTLRITGDANDYVGKGLSGGKLIIAPEAGSRLEPEKNMVVGNTVLYGATSGKAFFSGLAGERFCVRNSGAQAVVEGVGDHGCEYMTGGLVVVLGDTGKNFAAGMSGGIAYIYDKAKSFRKKCNMSMVKLEQLVDQDRIDELKLLIEEHAEYTNSPRAKAILNDWEKTMKDFVMVIPFEYRKVLAKQQSQKAC